MNEYLFYGYRLASEIKLPTLTPASGAGEPDVVLRLGPVAEQLKEATWTSPFIEIAPGGRVLAKIGNGLRFQISGGREILLQLANPEEEQAGEIETHLSGLVAGILLHQREALALHASAVTFDGIAVAFAGSSGIGKSTIASAFALHGYPLLADDVCRIQFDCGGGSRPTVSPGPPRLRLWPDMARTLGKAPESLTAGRTNHPKRLLTDVVPETRSRPLGAILRLAIDPRATEPAVERMTGPHSVMPIDELVYRTRLGRQLGRQTAIFHQLVELGNSVRVFRLIRPEGPPDVPRLLDLVQTAVREA